MKPTDALLSGGVITILPKSTFAIFPLIILLACPARNQLYGLRYDLIPFIIPYDKMNMFEVTA